MLQTLPGCAVISVSENMWVCCSAAGRPDTEEKALWLFLELGMLISQELCWVLRVWSLDSSPAALISSNHNDIPHMNEQLISCQAIRQCEWDNVTYMLYYALKETCCGDSSSVRDLWVYQTQICGLNASFSCEATWVILFRYMTAVIKVLILQDTRCRSQLRSIEKYRSEKKKVQKR